MPRVKDLSPETTAKNQFSNYLRGEAHIVYRGMPGFADAVGLSQSTIRRRVSDPREFSVNELRRVRKSLGVDKAEIMKFLEAVI